MASSILESSRLIGNTKQLDLEWVRAQFPSLAREVNGHRGAFLDGPGGPRFRNG